MAPKIFNNSSAHISLPWAVPLVMSLSGSCSVQHGWPMKNQHQPNKKGAGQRDEVLQMLC